MFTDAAGTARAIFVLSDSPRATTAVLLADRALRDVLSNERFELHDGRISVPMAAGAVRLLA